MKKEQMKDFKDNIIANQIQRLNNLLITAFLHVLFVFHNKNPDFTAVPAFSPGEQVGHQ